MPNSRMIIVWVAHVKFKAMVKRPSETGDLFSDGLCVMYGGKSPDIPTVKFLMSHDQYVVRS